MQTNDLQKKGILWESMKEVSSSSEGTESVHKLMIEAENKLMPRMREIFNKKTEHFVIKDTPLDENRETITA